ncbi:MAG: hypothetical protein WCS52_10230 [bacterium]
MAWPWQKPENEPEDTLLQEVTQTLAQVLGRSPGRTYADIHPAAHLGADLDLSSIAVARLAGLLQKRHGKKPLPFHMLFVKPDGSMLRDIRVSDVVTFLGRHLYNGHP